MNSLELEKNIIERERRRKIGEWMVGENNPAKRPEQRERMREHNPMKNSETAKRCAKSNIGKHSSLKIRKKMKEVHNSPRVKERHIGASKRSWKGNIDRKEKQKKLMLNGNAAHACSFNRNPSKPQVEMFEAIKRFFPTAVLNYPVKVREGKHYCLDTAVPELKWDFEWDEPYWHDKEKDRGRDELLKNKGWEVFRFSGDGVVVG